MRKYFRLIVFSHLLFFAAKLHAATGSIIGPFQAPHGSTTTIRCNQNADKGLIFVDTDATSGQQVYVCEGTAGWKLQGDGNTGSGGSAGYFASLVSSVTQNGAINVGSGTFAGTLTARNSGIAFLADGSNSTFSGFNPIIKHINRASYPYNSFDQVFYYLDGSQNEQISGYFRSAPNIFAFYNAAGSNILQLTGTGSNPGITIGSSLIQSDGSGNVSIGSGGIGYKDITANSYYGDGSHLTGISGGGGSGSPLEVFSLYSAVRSSPTLSIAVEEGLESTVAGSTFSFHVKFSSVASKSDLTVLETSTHAATTYATQSDVSNSTTNITNTFNNYYSSGSSQNLFNLKTVDATTYALQSVVSQSTTQLNSQFANYYSSGQSIGLFNLKTVDATTYALQSVVTQSTAQLNSQFSNYLTTGTAGTTYVTGSSITATYIPISTGTNAVGQLVRLDGSGKLPAIDGSQLTNLPSGGGGSGSWVGTATSTLNMAGYGIINVASITFSSPGGSYVDVGTNTFVGFVVNGTTWYVNQSSITFGGSAASLGTNILVSSFPLTGVTAGQWTLATVTVDSWGRISAISSGTASGAGYNGNSSLALATGSVMGFNSRSSTGTFVIIFDTTNFKVQGLQPNTTAYVSFASTLTTSGVPEGLNLYFTSARVGEALPAVSTRPFSVTVGSVTTPNPYGSGWSGSSVAVSANDVYNKIQSMSAGSGVLATDTVTWSGAHNYYGAVNYYSTVTWNLTAGFDFQENSTLLIPRAMDNSTYTAKGSLSYNMTDNSIYIGTGTFARPLAGHTTTTIFTGTGTYTPNPRMVTVKVTLVGTGGATGSCTGTDSVVGGGGGGGTAIKTFTRMQIGASQAVGIPAAPAAGTLGATATFGSLLTATSGGLASEGTAATVAISTIPGAGGVGTGGDINLTGGDGTPGIIVTTAIGIGGTGGSSYLGGGAYGGYVDKVGRSATGFGGGAGGCHAATATDRTGGAGGPAVAIIEEYLD